MTVERLVEEFRRQNPGRSPPRVTVEAGPTEPVAVSVAQRTFYLDAYSGRVLGTANQGMRQAMSKLRAWHRWLAVEGPGRPAARAITGWANVLFLFIVASGIYMWFPRRWTWQTVKAVLFFRPGASRQGQGLQLAQRDRHLVLGSAAHRRGQRRAHFVSVGNRARLPDGR